MGKDDIAVGKRILVFEKLGFAVEERSFAVKGDLKTVGFLESAVKKQGAAVMKRRFAVGKDRSVEEKMDAAVVEDDGAVGKDGGAAGEAGRAGWSCGRGDVGLEAGGGRNPVL